MNSALSKLAPSYYQYTYPTFVDAAQYISIHFLTPDGQKAFVSYPYHANYKAAQLISVEWFKSVRLERLAGQPVILAVIETFLTGWFTDGKLSPSPVTRPLSAVSPAGSRIAVGQCVFVTASNINAGCKRRRVSI